MTVESAIANADVGSVDVSIGNWRLAHATFEAINVVKETEIFNDHRRARSQLVVAIAAELFTRHTENIHGRKHRNWRWRQWIIHHRRLLLLRHHQEWRLHWSRLRYRRHLTRVENCVSVDERKISFLIRFIGFHFNTDAIIGG